MEGRPLVSHCFRCEAVSRDTNFYYSFLVLSAAKRRAIVAVWDFCRTVDDAVDAPYVGNQFEAATDPDRLRFELARWRREVKCCFGEDEPQTEQGRRLKPHVVRFNLPRRPFDDLIDGVEMDVGERRYEIFDDLYQYCLRVASAVGLICIEIFGYRDPRSRDYAVALGVALQLTNIIRDIATDLQNGRVYLPAEDLRRFDCTDRDLRDGQATRVRQLVKFECGRAQSFYRKARAALPVRDAIRLVAAEIMGAIYLAILQRIEQRDYDVFSEVIRIPRPRRAVIALTVWVTTLARAVVGLTLARVES